MKNFKIGKKFLVTFGIIAGMLLITVVLAISSLTQVRGKFTTFYEKPFVTNNYAMNMLRSLEASMKFFGNATMTKDLQEAAKYIQSAEDELNILRDGTAFMRENFLGDKALVEQFDTTMLSFREDRLQTYELVKQGKTNEAITLYLERVSPGLLEAQNILKEISSQSQANAGKSYDSADQVAGVATILLISAAVLALLSTIVLALYLTKSLTRPIREIETAANCMAAGKLNVQVCYTSRDELGSLSNSIRKLIENLRSIIGDVDYLLGGIADGNFTIKSKNADGYVGDFTGVLHSMRKLRDRLSSTLSQINQTAEQVASGSDQVASGSQALSQGTTEQAGSVEELAATINEISSQVKGTADNANEAHRVTGQAGELVEYSNQQMQEMISAMREISDKSGQIDKIIKTIEDIAFQTNILALNAAVEAARAGEAGKGFAVVANEVRSLASKSSQASQNTAVLIEGTVRAVEKGTGIANATAESLVAVVESAKDVVIMVEKITSAAQQQANSIAQVTQGIEQISSVVQTNSATAEESAAASEELSGQAQIMKELIGQFRLPSTEAIGATCQTERSSLPEAQALLQGEGRY